MKTLIHIVTVMGCGLLIHAEDVKVTIEKDNPSTICADGMNRDGTRWSRVSTETLATLTSSNLTAAITIKIDDGTAAFWSGTGTTFVASIASPLFKAVFISKEKTWLKASAFKNRKKKVAPNQAPNDTARKPADPQH